ncbi:MAG: ABC transporter ATP-binding protein [Spirochaetia bacterium]|nr:ABC transporter ATP-binding protein [Spirochaetia bacterium]
MKLKLDNIKISYPGKFTLNADLELKQGEFHTFLGPSGCGKTTLLRIIAGFNTPDSGRIYLDGKDITDLPPEKRSISIVFQDYALFPNMNVEKNIAYGPETQHWSKEKTKARVKELLEAVELPGYEKRKIETLSGGEKQRIALARAIAVNPALLLLDEPLSAADEKLKASLKAQIVETHRKNNLTTIYVTHDQEEAMTISDRISVFRRGNIECTGTPQEIYFNPKTLYTAKFVGQSNIIEGTVSSVGDLVEVRCTQGQIFKVQNRSYKYSAGDRVTLFFRPECCTAANGTEDNIIKGKIVDRIFYGRFYTCTVQTPMGLLTVYDTYPFHMDMAECSLTVSPDDIILFSE